MCVVEVVLRFSNFVSDTHTTPHRTSTVAVPLVVMTQGFIDRRGRHFTLYGPDPGTLGKGLVIIFRPLTLRHFYFRSTLRRNFEPGVTDRPHPTPLPGPRVGPCGGFKWDPTLHERRTHACRAPTPRTPVRPFPPFPARRPPRRPRPPHACGPVVRGRLRGARNRGSSRQMFKPKKKNQGLVSTSLNC